jgi:hypothetical protein
MTLGEYELSRFRATKKEATVIAGILLTDVSCLSVY